MQNYLKSGSVHSAVFRQYSFHLPQMKKYENTNKFRYISLAITLYWSVTKLRI